MNRGFYMASNAMMTEVMRHDTVANNLANINTTGFKQQKTIHHDFGAQFLKRIHANQKPTGQTSQLESPTTIGTLGRGSHITETYTTYEQGPLKETGNALDLALKGPGFFVIQTPEGQKYTRDGQFTLNAQNQLVTAEGFAVLGENGPISLPKGDINISSEGHLVHQGQTLAELKLVDFKDKNPLMNVGENFLVAPKDLEQVPVKAEVAQGIIEMSNVNLASEMINMITALRAYQVNQKALQTQDDMTGKAINEVGRTT